jgi:hypothetical protein
MSGCDHDGAPISDRTLDALRTTAAILASVPDVSARVRTTRGVVVEVRWPPFPELGHSAMAVCTFRRAVAKATQLRREGKVIAMLGLGGSEQPKIDIGSSVAGTVMPGGILRVECEDSWRHVVAAPVTEAVAVHALEGLDSCADVIMRYDAELDVTVLQLLTPAGNTAASAVAADGLIDAVAAIGVADLEARLGCPCPASVRE